jgi:uncharacterized membrane protein
MSASKGLEIRILLTRFYKNERKLEHITLVMIGLFGVTIGSILAITIDQPELVAVASSLILAFLGLSIYSHIGYIDRIIKLIEEEIK